MNRVLITFLIILLLASCSKNKASPEEYFIKLYAEICMKNITDPAAIKTEIDSRKIPSLPPEKAKYFLGNQSGQAWLTTMSDKPFVITLTENGPLCSVHAKEANIQALEKSFKQIVSTAPEGLVVTINEDDSKIMPMGKIHTLSYSWKKPDASKSIYFILSTNESTTANLQAKASVSIVRQ